MSSRLGAWCDGIVAAGWIAALVVVPLLFNVLSSSTFELDKAVMLRSIALAVALAWAISSAERRLARRSQAAAGSDRSLWWQHRGIRGWVWLVLAYLAVFAFATATSVAPRVSLWGSPSRVQGLDTTAAYLLLHLSLLAMVRRRDQVERLVTGAILASLPVALYGIIQHFGTDPVPWVTDFSNRVASTLGNPIFVAAFLVFVIPLTAYRQIVALRSAGRGEHQGVATTVTTASLLNLIIQVAAWWMGPVIGSMSSLVTIVIWTGEALLLGKPLLPFVQVGAYSAVLSAQLACLLLTQSRGPSLGLVAGLSVFGLAWAAARGRWRNARAVTGVGLALLVAVGAASLTTWGFESIRETRYLGRFSNLFESTGRVRLLIWDATTRLMMSDPLRSVIGYGPETLRLVSAPHISPALGQVEQRGALPDRAHNETLDAWVTTGLPGLLLYLTLFAMLFLRGLESAGIVRSPRDRRVFLSSMLIGAAAGASSAPWIDGSWRSAAPLLALGMVCGLCGYLVARSVSGWRGTGDPIPAGGDSGLLALAMLSALAGHFVEIQFGIAVTSTRLYFWTFAALLIVAPLWADREPTPGSEETALDEGSAALPWRELLGSSVIVTFTLVTLTYDFFPSRGPSSTPGSIVWLLAFAWVLGGVVVVAEAGARVADRMSRSMALKSAAVYGASTLVPAVLFAALHAIWTRSVTDLADVPRLFHPWLLLLILTAGAVFHSRRPPAPATRWALWAVPGVAAVMLFFAVETSARPVRADIFYKEALLLSMQRDGADQARGRIRRAIALEPENSVYHALHAEILLENALRSDDLRESESLLEQGEQSIRMARHLSPLDPDYPADRARLNLRWSARVPDAARRSSRLERTVDLYREALAVSPSNVLLWNELGVTRLLKGDLEAALETFNHSLRLDDAFAETHLHLANVYRRQGDAEHAARALEAATALMPPERRAAIEDLAEALLRLESIEPASR